MEKKSSLYLSKLNQIQKGKSPVRAYWIRHPRIQDEAILEELYEKFLNLAISRKVKTNEQVLAEAKESGLWTDKLEGELAQQRAYLKKLQESFEKALTMQKNSIQESIEKSSKKIQELSQKKSAVLGKTAETWADKMSIEKYVVSLVFKDENLTELMWSEEEADYLDEDQMNFLYDLFIEFKQTFSEKDVKSLAVEPFCQNLFDCSSGCIDFYGTHVLSLTYLQQRLYFHLKNYNTIIGMIGGKVSPETLSNWEKMDEWARASEKAREQLENMWTRNTNNSVTMDSIKKSAEKKGSRLENAKNIKKLLS